MRLGWWQLVIYIVDDCDVIERLRRAGILQSPGHYFLNAAECGIGGQVVALPEGAREPWWTGPLRATR